MPKTSPDMSPTPTTVKSCFCDVDVELAEVPGHRLPRAAGGDAHGLVVVADRAAGGERVAEPEAALERDGVGQVGEGRRPLVGRDDEVGVVAVVPDHPLRRDDGAVDQVVGQRQQRADEQLVAGLPLGEDGVARGAVRRRLLDDEAALGAGRHDDGVLHHLRLDQAEHLGAQVLAAVGPAQPAAGDRAEAQVDAHDARRADPHLAGRAAARAGRGRRAGRA